MKLVLGTMTFGQGERIADPETVKSILDFFYDAGFDELDTARMYDDGKTEVMLGLIGDQRFKIATKAFPFQPGMLSKSQLPDQLAQSMAALKLPIDIFNLHQPDYATPIEETLETVNELYVKGYFKAFGLSNFSAWQVADIYRICQQNGYIRPTVYQVAHLI